MSGSSGLNDFFIAFMAFVQRNARGIVLSVLILLALSRIAIGIVTKYVRIDAFRRRDTARW